MTRAKFLALALGLFILAGCAGGPEKHVLSGETVVGDRYGGSITLTPRDQTFDVVWERVSSLPHRGFALRLDNVLGAVAEDTDTDFGVVLYRVKGGHLEGIWQGNQGRRWAAVGQETLDGADGLDGIFKISLGINPDGSHYSGKVSIHKAGRMYSVNWYTKSGLRYIGTGVLVGNIFVVGFSAEHRSGVAAYCLRSAETGEGITALITDGGLGAEVFGPADSTTHPRTPLDVLRDSDATFDCTVSVSQNPA